MSTVSAELISEHEFLRFKFFRKLTTVRYLGRIQVIMMITLLIELHAYCEESQYLDNNKVHGFANAKYEKR